MPRDTTSPRNSLTQTLKTASALRASLMIEAARADWRAIEAAQADDEKAMVPLTHAEVFVWSMLRPRFALAKAELGDAAGAEKLMKDTPADCYDCLRTRGAIAALAGEAGRADYWFARAVAAGPSLPQAETDWATALLARGDADAAIAKFKLANQKGPHFADPLERGGR